MNSGKMWASGFIDFAITAGTAFLALPQDADIDTRIIVTILVGALVSTGKGLKTYHATSPGKIEVGRR